MFNTGQVKFPEWSSCLCWTASPQYQNLPTTITKLVLIASCRTVT